MLDKGLVRNRFIPTARRPYLLLRHQECRVCCRVDLIDRALSRKDALPTTTTIFAMADRTAATSANGLIRALG